MLRRPMYRKLLIATALVGLLLAAATVAFAAHDSADPGEPKAFSMLGLANVQGETVIVDVVVAVGPGQNAAEVARAALREQGARPFDSAEFSTTGLVWDQFSDGTTNPFVIQNYNPANDPTGNGETALTNSQDTWTNVASSLFVLTDGGTTTRCPSLVRECPGRQRYDGNNDVAWLALSGCCTLGVTWFSTSIDEADMALNTKFNWSTSCTTEPGKYDAETVFLHENGHVVGLGHSDVAEAVMYAYYGGPRCDDLHADDEQGISSLYPADGGTPEPTPTPTPTATPSGDEPTATATPTPMPTATPSSGTVSVASITYATTGGPNSDKHLFITVALDPPADGASVSIDLLLNSSFYGSATGTTGTDGTVTFKATNAPSGTYTTTVTDVTAEGLTWDDETPENSFTK